jgi:hypothetical protein
MRAAVFGSSLSAQTLTSVPTLMTLTPPSSSTLVLPLAMANSIFLVSPPRWFTSTAMALSAS